MPELPAGCGWSKNTGTFTTASTTGPRPKLNVGSAPVGVIVNPMGIAGIRGVGSRETSAASVETSVPPFLRNTGKGWVTADWGISETNRKVRFYRITPEGSPQYWLSATNPPTTILPCTMVG